MEGREKREDKCFCELFYLSQNKFVWFSSVIYTHISRRFLLHYLLNKWIIWLKRKTIRTISTLRCRELFPFLFLLTALRCREQPALPRRVTEPGTSLRDTSTLFCTQGEATLTAPPPHSPSSSCICDTH